MKTAFFSLALILTLCVNFVSAQWVQQPDVAGWDIDFVDSNTGWYIGDSGALKKSTNGGANWTAQSLGATGFRCRGIDMIDANTGFICTELGGRVYKTTNSGTNWTLIYDLSSNSMYDIDFLNVNTGIAVGFGSRLIRTTNSGANWTDVTFSGNGDFYDVFVESATVSYIVTSNWRILKSTDGGANYSVIYTDVGALTSIMFTDIQTGFVSAGYGAVLKTTNAGANWTKYLSGVSNIAQIHFTNSQTGYVCGQNGKLLTSINGGVNWTTQPTGINLHMYRMDFANPLTGWAIGTGGMVKTTNGGLGLPYAPVLAAPSNNAVNRPVATPLDWDSASALVSFRVQVAQDSMFTNMKLDTTITTSNITVPQGRLAGSTKYYWRAMATNTIGGGPWSTVWNFTTGTLPAASTLIAPANNSTGLTVTPPLDWDSTGTSFRVQVSTDSMFLTAAFDTTLNRSAVTVPSGRLAGNTKYYWRAMAFNSIGSGVWSLKWNFTTAPVTGITNAGGEIPGEFKLYNNYPNPFNPSTRIKFDIPNAQHVKVIVYDVLGKAVATLIDKQLSAGKYEAEFNGSGLTSGIYFYRIEAGDFRQVMKMVLAK